MWTVRYRDGFWIHGSCAVDEVMIQCGEPGRSTFRRSASRAAAERWIRRNAHRVAP